MTCARAVTDGNRCRGELSDATPANFELLQGALSVVVPRTLPANYRGLAKLGLLRRYFFCASEVLVGVPSSGSPFLKAVFT